MDALVLNVPLSKSGTSEQLQRKDGNLAEISSRAANGVKRSGKGCSHYGDKRHGSCYHFSHDSMPRRIQEATKSCMFRMLEVFGAEFRAHYVHTRLTVLLKLVVKSTPADAENAGG